ncbi:DUF4032 domain-containing protein [Ilumatobacter nonamiensis]|uniref:DUF4032 domain-containing protein n=1 Tax=Ilumatobacter nonamiensis TaxID=467093 RepID=UPI00058B5C8E|nr:DUF4032 domain-containing protein [Ilumatobacter nonamiensis]
MRLQIANPSAHPNIGQLPFAERLADWDRPHMHGVLGLHRHVVRLIELDGTSYVIKELPDNLVQREYRLLRELDELGLPTAEVVAAVTEKPDSVDGLLVTRHIDYSLPYRTLLAGRGLTIPYLGERVLDSLVVLLVRLHLAGFFWGDCSLSNTLFRRDAGALSAYVIDMETGEKFDQLSDGQRRLDLQVATENVAGGLFDLQAGGRLRSDIDPMDVALQIEERYGRLWDELTAPEELDRDVATRTVQRRIERLHDLGFDVEEMDIVDEVDGGRLRYIPRVVEHGFHSERLRHLTGLETTENQARRLLDDIRSFGHTLNKERHARIDAGESTGYGGAPVRNLPENVIAVRWLDDRFEPLMAQIPPELFSKLEGAEIYHQLLEHRWFLSEQSGADVPLEDALEPYIRNVLASAPDEVTIARKEPEPGSAESTTFLGYE